MFHLPESRLASKPLHPPVSGNLPFAVYWELQAYTLGSACPMRKNLHPHLGPENLSLSRQTSRGSKRSWFSGGSHVNTSLYRKWFSSWRGEPAFLTATRK